MERTELIQQIFENQGKMKRSMQHYFVHTAQELPVSRAQMELLFAIKHNQPVHSRKLAEYLSMTPGAVSQLLDTLLTQELVERTADANDRRLQLLNLSKKGEKLASGIEKQRLAFMDKVIGELDTEELAVWLHVQQTMLKHMEMNTYKMKGNA